MFVFRPILNTSAEYANFHFPAQHEATLPYMMEMSLYLFTGAIVANLFVIYLSFFSPLVDGNFKYFMANVAFCDFCIILSICFEACSQMYHDFMNVPYTATTCYTRIVFPIAFAGCMIFALLLTAVNRYVVIVMRRDDWFTKPRVFLLCVCSYWPLLLGPLIDLLFAPYVTNYLDCDFILYTPYIEEMFLFAILLFVIPLLVFCSLRVYQLLSQHISVVSAKLNKTPEQIRIEKSILKAIIIQSLLPVICAMPLFFILLTVILQGWESPALHLTIFRYGENGEYHYTLTHLCIFIVASVPILDPFITLSIVNSYRRAANKFLTKFKIYRKFTGTVLEDTVTDTVPVRARFQHATVAPI